MSLLRRLAVLVIRVASIVMLIVVSISVFSGCGGSSTHASVKPTSTLPVPKDPAPVTIVKGRATTLDLGGGAHLIIPPDAMTPGATVRATYQGRPTGNWSVITPTFAPVELIANPPDAIHGLLTIEFPVPVDKIMSGVDPTVQFGISTYDKSTKTWTPVESAYDQDRHMVVALIPHFSWWNPFTWDFSALFASIAQGFGQLVGERTGPPTCSGGAPSWVGSLAGVLQDADVAIRSCAQSKNGDILDIQIRNNRPYSQVLTYGSSVSWGWHEPGESAMDKARNMLVDHFIGRNQLYLPPLGAASVGIFKPAPGTNSVFYIGPNAGTIGVDLAFYALGKGIDWVVGKAVERAIALGSCGALDFDTHLNGVSVSALRDYLAQAFKCVEEGFSALVASGVLNKEAVGQLDATYAAIHAARVAGVAIVVGDVAWKIGDLIADWKLVSPSSILGNGFSVYAKSALPPPTVTPVPPHPQPTVTPAPTSHPVNAYDNYGQSNLAGHAMCRGNPNNYLSMPGGVGTQTFTVPNGVSTLNSAMVQIDPAPVTAHLSIAVNGNVVATTAANAVGDTHFYFGTVSVHPGDVITLRIAFTATDGKIITLYTVGNPGGRFTASNSCPDGAPNYTTTTSGLRGVVSGMS